jgi:hypothetical protein
MTEEEKRELFLILDYYMIYNKKAGTFSVNMKEFEKYLQEFITRVKTGEGPESKDS